MNYTTQKAKELNEEIIRVLTAKKFYKATFYVRCDVLNYYASLLFDVYKPLQTARYKELCKQNLMLVYRHAYTKAERIIIFQVMQKNSNKALFRLILNDARYKELSEHYYSWYYRVYLPTLPTL